jgi:hypothetical protein
MDTLAQLRVPQTQENANALLAQFQAEESRIDLPPSQNVANYNPGNIEVATAQSFHDKGIVGGWPIAPQIAMFDTFAHGVDAYANALKRIAPQAVADMKANAGAPTVAHDIAASGWGTTDSTMQSILAAGSERGAAARYPVTAGKTGLNTLVPPKGNGGDSIIPNIPGLPKNPLDEAASAIKSAFSTVLPFLTRIGLIVGGVVILLVAIIIAVKT